jgi:uncharacterized protein
MDLHSKKAAAISHLTRCGSAVVALSGGVDSAVLLSLALEALGPERLLAATGSSPALAAADLEAARQVAAALGAPHIVVPTREIERPGYRANRGDRCFHCRSELFETLGRLARERGLDRVVYGAIADDRGDERPGMRAAKQLGAVAPLLEAGLGKREVRELATAAGLPVADRPANACLASRIPVGSVVTAEKLTRIERAEESLGKLGFEQLRVRDHGEVARLEVDARSLERLHDAGFRGRIVSAVRDAGFRFVAVDLEGYRSGSVAGSGSTAPQRTGPTRDGGQ